jgi:hypothetical protein
MQINTTLHPILPVDKAGEAGARKGDVRGRLAMISERLAASVHTHKHMGEHSCRQQGVLAMAQTFIPKTSNHNRKPWKLRDGGAALGPQVYRGILDAALQGTVDAQDVRDAAPKRIDTSITTDTYPITQTPLLQINPTLHNTPP